jgi:NADH dehydrogenase/NADH:ubiquinone oxidoreductase subunit G
MISIKINKRIIQSKSEQTIFQVAKKQGVDIPTICHMPGLESRSVCRICSVEINGYDKLFPACSTLIEQNMEIKTHSQKVLAARKVLLEFIIAEHGGLATLSAQVQQYAAQLGVKQARFYLHNQKQQNSNRYSSDYIKLEQEKCIHCDRCIRACRDNSIISRAHRGSSSLLTFGTDDALLEDTACTNCGDCVAVCPTGAINCNSTNFI